MNNPPPDDANNPWVAPEGLTTNTQASWQERERRQRTVRFLLSYLLMLLLMDNVDQTAQRERAQKEQQLLLQQQQQQQQQQDANPLFVDLHQRRMDQDHHLHSVLTYMHPRYERLVALNENKDYQQEMETWWKQRQQQEGAALEGGGENNNMHHYREEQMSVAWHYPWNASGIYRGDWVLMEAKNRTTTTTTTAVGTDESDDSRRSQRVNNSNTTSLPLYQTTTPKQVESAMLETLHHRRLPNSQQVGVCLLPEGLYVPLPNITSSTRKPASTTTGNKIRTSSSNVYRSPSSQQQNSFLRGHQQLNTAARREVIAAALTRHNVTLEKDSGRVIMRLSTRSIPGMKEISLIDGVIKLFDSESIGYSTSMDVLLRVKGVVLHSIGRVSMVATRIDGRGALVISSGEDGGDIHIPPPTLMEASTSHRKLEEKIAADGVVDDPKTMQQIHQELLRDLPPTTTNKQVNSQNPNREKEEGNDVTETTSRPQEEGAFPQEIVSQQRRKVEQTPPVLPPTIVNNSNTTTAQLLPNNNRTSNSQLQSHIVIPFPFAPDNERQSLRLEKPVVLQGITTQREQSLELNAGACEFEIDLDVQEIQWTLEEWSQLVRRGLLQQSQMKAYSNLEAEDSRGVLRKRPSDQRNGQNELGRQALVMMLNGTLESRNCNFQVAVNATAVRTNWSDTTSKAINYSFYMMVTCLTQIIVLLRQLLHTQGQTAATKVSLLCVGWQTVLDALLCLVHIYLSLSLHPLFTAFASIAFFKLLLFGVIQLKYMAIIIQARNTANVGGNSIERLRRQIAMLHFRFYVAVVFAFLMLFYSWKNYRTWYFLLLYSFWVPQIVNNVVTESKRPLHRYYVHGMTLTRLVAPVYMFALKKNFLKEVYPEFPTDLFMCEILIFWVALQAAILEAQRQYGARFMIPSRFQPPKYDYSRPIPRYLFPSGATIENQSADGLSPSEVLQIERGPAPDVSSPYDASSSTNQTSNQVSGARNRMKGKKTAKSEGNMTTETVAVTEPDPTLPSFDCVICYTDVDIRNRKAYMLAPCDHIFHRDCLVQWMEVKMECPTCRAELPAL